MIIRFQRSIRPVGQGAFYTEHFKIDDQIINVVYDCGTLTKINGMDPKEAIKEEIHRTFSKGEKIEYVFVSHFDEDHSNGIIELCKHCDVTHLVIPLITEFEWQLFTRESDTSVGRLLRWIESPESREILVYAVRAFDGDGADSFKFHEFKRPGIEPIGSEYEMALFSHRGRFKPFWHYIPFNFLFQQRYAAFAKQLDSTGIDVSRIKGGDPVFIAEHKEEIAKALDAVPGSRNANSMCVLSAAVNEVESETMYFEDCCCLSHSLDSSCLYTGDYEAGGKRKLRELFAHYTRFDHIGILQIPHHGSYRNFSHELIDQLSPQLCFVSAGFKNGYQHPNGSVVRYVMNQNIPFVIVNEFAGTARYWNWILYWEESGSSH